MSECKTFTVVLTELQHEMLTNLCVDAHERLSERVRQGGIYPPTRQLAQFKELLFVLERAEENYQ